MDRLNLLNLGLKIPDRTIEAHTPTDKCSKFSALGANNPGHFVIDGWIEPYTHGKSRQYHPQM
jgi:hypothetical protein